MVLEGASPRQVDGALKTRAWRWDFAVFDMAGVDVGVNVHRANAHVVRLILFLPGRRRFT